VDAVATALEVELVDKENAHMIRRTKDPIPAFIPVHHHIPNSFPYQSNSRQDKIIPILLDTKEPMLMLTALTSGLDQIRSKMKSITNEMTKSMRELQSIWRASCGDKGKLRQSIMSPKLIQQEFGATTAASPTISCHFAHC
jgi:hypothetical protein